MSEEPRITALESRVAYLEHALDEVNRVVLSLDQTRSAQSRELSQLRNRLSELSEAGTSPTHEPPPPHY